METCGIRTFHSANRRYSNSIFLCPIKTIHHRGTRNTTFEPFANNNASWWWKWHGQPWHKEPFWGGSVHAIRHNTAEYTERQRVPLSVAEFCPIRHGKIQLAFTDRSFVWQPNGPYIEESNSQVLGGVPARNLHQLSCALLGDKPQIDVEALNSFINWKSLCPLVPEVLEYAFHFCKRKYVSCITPKTEMLSSLPVKDSEISWVFNQGILLAYNTPSPTPRPPPPGPPLSDQSSLTVLSLSLSFHKKRHLLHLIRECGGGEHLPSFKIFNWGKHSPCTRP